ncbi:MAG: MBL fold metallo-hydrolase, partial [Lachnospira sp.]|nr:MBL fold metallo-hydrolase [Lachnospira sp.]
MWHVAPCIDYRRCRVINIYHTVLGMVGTNCYIIVNEECKSCVVVDPADNAKAIYGVVEQAECKLDAILLTHGHFDHMLAAKELKEVSGATICAAQEEKA